VGLSFEFVTFPVPVPFSDCSIHEISILLDIVSYGNSFHSVTIGLSPSYLGPTMSEMLEGAFWLTLNAVRKT
jgi:hypothetical protein